MFHRIFDPKKNVKQTGNILKWISEKWRFVFQPASHVCWRSAHKPDPRIGQRGNCWTRVALLLPHGTDGGCHQTRRYRNQRYSSIRIRNNEGNVLFNDALNTFYIRLYGVRHMVKDHTKAREETRCCHMGYSFRLAARVLLYASSHRQDNTYHGLCNTSRGALAGMRNSWYKVILLIIKFWFAIILILHVLILYATFLFHSFYTTPSLF